MRYAEYKLPAGVHPSLEPVQTGTTPDTKDAKGNVVKGKPIYEYRVIKTAEAESLDEFVHNLVEQDKPEDHTNSLAQAQLDIIKQRKIREAAQSQEVADMFDGKNPDTKDLSDDERLEYVLAYLQEVGDTYKYGSRPASTSGGNAVAKQALAREKAIKEAATQSPEVAAKLAELEATLASLGIKV